MNFQNKSIVLNVVLAIAVVVLGVRLASGEAHEAASALPTGDSTQVTGSQEADADGFTPFDFTEAFQGNPFSFFMGDSGHGTLLCAGDKSGANAMAIGWGALGTLWGKHTATVYVRSDRHTHQFLEKCPYFTIMTFADDNVLDYMGTHSGRDGDKAAALGLHIAYTKHGAPYYKEATQVIECRTMFARPFMKEGYRDAVPRDFYADPSTYGHVHTEFIGEIVGAMKKQTK